jgi:hypothetical protein
MNDKTPFDFSTHGDWLAYVRENVPAAGQSYALACGRTELFKSFYKVRKETFPVEFAMDLEHVETFRDPERTARLEALNDRILAALSELLFKQARPDVSRADPTPSASPRECVQELLDHLAMKNPHFPFWTAHKEADEAALNSTELDIDRQPELDSKNESDIAFTLAMRELEQLLRYFCDRNLSLPKYMFERSWFLHLLHEPERMLQTHALLNTLTAEIEACASA